MKLNLGMLNNSLRGLQTKHTTAIISKKLDNFYYILILVNVAIKHRKSLCSSQ